MSPRKGRRVWARTKSESGYYVCSDGARIRRLTEREIERFRSAVQRVIDRGVKA